MTNVLSFNLLIILFFLGIIDANGQNLKVDEFIVKNADLTARTQPRIDLNGVECALVKVRMAASGASFSGNVMGDVKYTTSEYFVYMPQGSKRLTVKLEGYLPLDVNFPDYGINNLESKTTYQLTISGVASGKELEPVRVKTGWIILESEPSGASVYINDEFIGTTPLNNYKQTYGTYSFRLERPNYYSSDGVIELNSNRYEQKIILKPACGSIEVTSNVSGAQILLDGKPTGKVTPSTLNEVPSGSHTIAIQKEKYAPRQQEINVKDGEIVQMNLSLYARFAQITINSLEGAQVYCNGQIIGRGTLSENMIEGYYDLEVRLDHHKSVTKQIQVVAGQSQEITLNPMPIYGSLDVTSTPHDATVMIDGKQVGKTPLTINQLLEGEHQVAVYMTGYEKGANVVEIHENEVASISFALNKESVATLQDRASFSGDDIEVFTVNGVSFKMIRVEGGTFTMGATSEQGGDIDNTERPTHLVTLSTYYIGETEVTQELWQAIMNSNPSEASHGLKLPVDFVSWFDCQEFVTRLYSLTGKKFRLPTEAEWEFAARGGNKSRGYKYSGSNTLDNVAWYPNNSKGVTHNVGTKTPNELGLYDMNGNVWEWCEDMFKDYSSANQTNPIVNEFGKGHVTRGGAFYGHARYCRISARLYSSDRGYYIGLRLAL